MERYTILFILLFCTHKEGQMFEWLFGKTYTEKQIDELLDMIEAFNAGAVDDPLSRHIAMVYEEWKAKQV
jgi:hypothetical protein